MTERERTHASFQNVVVPPVGTLEPARPELAEIKEQLDRIEQALKALLRR